MLPYESCPDEIKIILPAPHERQSILYTWDNIHPEAQTLVAPCGTKFGKSYGCALWLLTKALQNPGSYCIWIAPTYLKSKIGYRYIKAMCNIPDFVDPVDGSLEIRFVNGSFIKFLHGKDAETTVEGEAVDFFIIDESGKTSKQVWYSLFTTLTQTGGRGIATGTPRGFNWYYDVFRQAKRGDPFYCWAQFKTEDSPYVSDKAIEQAKRLLPKALFDQYYMAKFVSAGSVFGDLQNIWDESLKLPEGKIKFWVHPDNELRNKVDTIHGVDFGKKQDWTVFYSVNTLGKLVGFARFRHVPYTAQIDRLSQYLNRFFKETDNHIRYDATGVGGAIGDIIAESEIDATITPVTFTNKSKQEMVTRATLAFEQQWHSAPRIEEIEHEFASYEVNVTRSGLHSYAAPDGEHDDIVSAGMLAISAAYQSSMADEAEKMLEQTLDGTLEKEEDLIEAWADAAGGTDEDDFFDENEDSDDDFSFDRENE